MKPKNFKLRSGVFLIFLVLTAYWCYILQKRRMIESFIRKSELVKVNNGIIEFTVSGSGPTILISHGTLGGFDQGIGISKLFLGIQARYIAVSRAGYLRSSLESQKSPEEQADDFAILLDHLAIDRAIIMGLSGGAPAAVAFALRHSDRCDGLVLISSLTKIPPPLPRLLQIVVGLQDTFLRLDFLWWSFLKLGLRPLLISNGLTLSQTSELMKDRLKVGVCKSIFSPVGTASLRRYGVKNDGLVLNQLPDFPLESVSVPSLIIHSPTDKLAPFNVAKEAAERIPRATILELADGGHLSFVVHQTKVTIALAEFMSQLNLVSRDI